MDYKDVIENEKYYAIILLLLSECAGGYITRKKGFPESETFSFLSLDPKPQLRLL